MPLYFFYFFCIFGLLFDFLIAPCAVCFVTYGAEAYAVLIVFFVVPFSQIFFTTHNIYSESTNHLYRQLIFDNICFGLDDKHFALTFR